jgi:2-succinyl-5-enolpyruvyl-6-hydroxy-3-cyclohexene-1-carboxylate synthase
MTASPATDWSVAFLGQLVAKGISHVVVSPGARSQALALAALAWERASEGALSVHVVIDERSAAFRALGLALESKRPALCIATSGSAPAHYFPAVLEALHAGVPLIVVAADRPEELHGVGANQTTIQQELFGPRVPSWTIPAPDGSGGSDAKRIATEVATAAYRGGPAYVSVSFREPLSSAIPEGSLVMPEVVVPDLGSSSEDKNAPDVVSLEPEAGTVVIAGHGAGPRAEALALELGAPLIAEVVSGARFGPHLVPAYRQVLRDEALAGGIQRVVTVGRPTLSREVSSLLGRTDITQIVLKGRELEAANPSRVAQVVDNVVVTRPATQEESALWVKPWVMAGRRLHEAQLAEITPAAPDIEALTSNDPATRSAFATQEMKVLRQSVARESLALAVWEATWPHDRLVLGASRMVRVADSIVPGKNIPVFSNRGLSGIDGTVSTARGIAKASSATGVTRVLLGDLALLHDVGSLLVEPGIDDSSRVHLIVANDGGGTIFDELEVSQVASQEDRDRVLLTPHEVSLEALAGAYGWAYRRVNHLGDLAEALSASDARLIVDVAIARGN